MVHSGSDVGVDRLLVTANINNEINYPSVNTVIKEEWRQVISVSVYASCVLSGSWIII